MDLRCDQRRALVNTNINVMFILETGNFLSIVSPSIISNESSFLELANPELIHQDQLTKNKFLMVFL
jgi:hypothetical protein